MSFDDYADDGFDILPPYYAADARRRFSPFGAAFAISSAFALLQYANAADAAVKKRFSPLLTCCDAPALL